MTDWNQMHISQLCEGPTITYEPHNRDDRDLLITPGYRLRISSSDGQCLILDRWQLVKALAFLETQKPEAERESWCATCGQRAELETA